MRSGPVEGAIVKSLLRHGDDRGFFEEIIRRGDPFFAAGFGQLSWARREAGTVTAWHLHPTQWDWWFVPHGRLRAVLHDLRSGPTSGHTFEVLLGEGAPDAVLAVPPGVAHGYKVLVGPAEILYVTSREYDPAEEGRLPHDDPSIGYDWSAP